MEAAADSGFEKIKITAYPSKEHRPQGLLGSQDSQPWLGHSTLRDLPPEIHMDGTGDAMFRIPGGSATQSGLGPIGVKVWFCD